MHFTYTILITLPGALLLGSSPTLGAPVPTDGDLRPATSTALQHTRREPVDINNIRFGMPVAAARGGVPIGSRDLASSDDATHVREVNLDSRSMIPGNEMNEGVSFLRYPREVPGTAQSLPSVAAVIPHVRFGFAMGNNPVRSRGLAYDDDVVHARSLGTFGIPGNDFVSYLIDGPLAFLYKPHTAPHDVVSEAFEKACRHDGNTPQINKITGEAECTGNPIPERGVVELKMDQKVV